MASHKFDTDQLVWVTTWDEAEEPGTIVSLKESPKDSSNDDRSDDGPEYIVRLHVSARRITCSESQMRGYEEATTGKEGGRATRSRQSQPKRKAVTPSPAKKKIAHKKQGPAKTAKKDPKNEQPKKRASGRKKKTNSESSDAVEEKTVSSPFFAKKATKDTNEAEAEPEANVISPIQDSTEKEDLFCQPVASDDEQSVAMIQENGGSDEELDCPFTVEYAPTGRARCARCDDVIGKGELRITHKPLFRGGRGFQVSRHLPCAIFNEEIEKAEDVGGWKSLKKEDYCMLALRVEESKMELEDEKKELQPDELVQTLFQGETRKPPQGLAASLLPFQVEGVSWMYHQETQMNELRGGILADEMGMGKTLQTITTILDNRPLLQHAKPGTKHPPSCPDVKRRQHEESLWTQANKDWKHEMEMIGVAKRMIPKKNAGARAGTLVICPVIALSQWKSEIEKFTEPNTLSVGIYHGTKRASEMPSVTLQKYDVILTTYQVLEQDFRKMVSPNKISCPNCGGKYKIDKLRVHLKYFCGDGAERTEAQSRQRRSSENRGNETKKNSKGKKKSFTKQKVMQSSPKKSKTLKLKSTETYDSESDLSLDEDVIIATSRSKSRPSRSAAKKASKKLTTSAKEWRSKTKSAKADDDDGDSAYSEVSDDNDDLSDSSSSEEERPTKRRKVSVEKDTSQAVKRARQRQADALSSIAKKQTMKSGGTKGNKTKQPPKGKKPNKGKKRGKHSDSSDSEEDGAKDPMEGIDMEALTEKAMEGSQFSLLHSVCWWRVVLDEAHYIKSRSSQTSHAAFSLTSIHRWCLSGTPLQNRVGELFSLIRFLRISPMAHYFCRLNNCDCQNIHYRIKQGVCQDCNHRQFSHYSYFNKHVLTPIQRDGYTGDGRRAMFKLKTDVLDKCLLRRTKETKAEDLNLPPRIVRIKYVRLHPIEEDFYQGLYTQTKASFDDYVAEGTLLNNYAHIFDLLTKMRQAVDHPYLLVHSRTNHMKLAGKTEVANGSVDCEMCHEPPTGRVVSSCCGAGFCRSCVIEYITGSGGENTPCPSCREPFSIDLNQKSTEPAETPASSPVRSSEKDPVLKDLPHIATGSILRRINLAEFATSTKIEVLVQSLVEMRKERPGGKALVFSQFVNMLDLVRWRLHSDPFLSDLGLGVRIIHGGMDAKSRDAALKDFREDSECRVLLMSLKAAGVALNLTVASECYLLDLWWNPAAEMQAIDRCHRLGQHRPIRAVRFVAEGTVEERVLQLQEKKRLVFDGTVGRDAGSLKMLTANDMKSLFS